jgi:uncharacterized membrane protein YbhN (UPF0104 family)
MKKIVKTTLLALGMCLAASALISRWPEIQPRLVGCNWFLLALAALGLLVYQFLNAGVWSLVLGSLGQRVSFARAAQVWLQSEALRWLPGGIWGYGSRVLNAKELGVSKSKASASLILELALTNLAWALTASILLFSPLVALVLEALSKLIPRDLPWILVSVGIVGVTMLALVSLLSFSKSKDLREKALQLLPWRELEVTPLLLTLFSYLGLCLCNGLILWIVIAAVPNLSVSPLVVLGIGAGAWLAGFWAIGVPGGIGVREAALALMLAAFGDLDSGIAVAVLWRALQMAVEILSLLLVSLPVFQKRKKAKTTVPGPSKSNSSCASFRLLNTLP